MSPSRSPIFNGSHESLFLEETSLEKNCPNSSHLCPSLKRTISQGKLQPNLVSLVARKVQPVKFCLQIHLSLHQLVPCDFQVSQICVAGFQQFLCQLYPRNSSPFLTLHCQATPCNTLLLLKMGSRLPLTSELQRMFRFFNEFISVKTCQHSSKSMVRRSLDFRSRIHATARHFIGSPQNVA